MMLGTLRNNFWANYRELKRGDLDASSCWKYTNMDLDSGFGNNVNFSLITEFALNQHRDVDYGLGQVP